MTEVRVDRTRCAGAGLCVSMSPALFRLTGDGHAIPVKAHLSDSDELETALDISECCPTEAISLATRPEGPAQEQVSPCPS